MGWPRLAHPIKLCSSSWEVLINCDAYKSVKHPISFYYMNMGRFTKNKKVEILGANTIH